MSLLPVFLAVVLFQLPLAELIHPMQTIKDVFANPLVGFLLKMVAGIATAIFAYIGLGRDARKPDGTLLARGRVAIIGIVCGCLLGLTSVLYDYFSAQKASREEKEKSQRLLLSVQRGIYPLRGINATFTIQLNQDFVGLAEYKAAVEKAVNADRDCVHPSPFECDDTGR